MSQGQFVKYGLIIIAILIIVFLSQLAYFKQAGSNIISGATDQAGAYLAKGSNWIMANLYPKIDSGVQGGGETIQKTIQNSIDQTAQNVSDAGKNISEKISDYFSGIENSILHPGQTNNCPAQPNDQ